MQNREPNTDERLNESDFSIQDFTVMKLMEEIVEFDQEIKLKQTWINSRIKLLHQIQKKQEGKEMKSVIHEFLKKIQPDYPEKLSVEYQRTGPAIPMSMSDAYNSAIPMGMADKYSDPIPMDGPVIEEVTE